MLYHQRVGSGTRFLCLITSVCVCLFSSVSAADSISLFVVTGQSNARPNYALGVESGLRASGKYERVVVYNKRRGGSWLNQWINSSGGDYSPSTNMLEDLWSQDGSSELQQLIASLEADGHSVTLEGFFWFQGESDTINAGSRATYAARFTWMINKLREEYGPFAILVTMVDWNHNLTQQLLDDGYTPEGVEELRTVQAQVAQELGGISFDSRDYIRADLWHVGGSDDPRGFYARVTDLGADQAGAFVRFTSCEADLNGDGVLNFFDVSTFLQLFQQGCP